MEPLPLNSRSGTPAPATAKITLTISPPSRAPTPKVSDDDSSSETNVGTSARAAPKQAPISSTAATLSPTSYPCSRADSFASNSSYTSTSTACDSRSSFSRNNSNIELLNGSSDAADITTYHVYQTGKASQNYSLHTEPDSSLISPKSTGVRLDKGFCLENLYHRITSVDKDSKQKVITADDPKTDPRKACYYLHKPRVYLHDPPQTLRFGGDKTAPVVCLVSGSWNWKVWRLDFVLPKDEGRKRRFPFLGKKMRTDSEGDEAGERAGKAPEIKRSWTGLNEPGVIDSRGVVASKYPLRKFRQFRGETGKAFHRSGTKTRNTSPQLRRSSPAAEQKEGANSSATTGESGVSDTSEDILPEGRRVDDLPEHLRPESLDEGSLLMNWTGWFTREYVFTHRGVQYRWKGTRTVGCSQKDPWYKFTRFSHLKLIGIIPEEDGEQEEGEAHTEETEKEKEAPKVAIRRERSFSSFVSTLGRSETSSIREKYLRDEQKEREEAKRRAREVVVATYSCSTGKRKCGRLKVSEGALEKMSRVGVGENLGEKEREIRKERLRHVVVGTGLCMMQGEQQKKDAVREIAITTVVEAASAAS